MGLPGANATVRKYSAQDCEAIFEISQRSLEAAHWAKEDYDRAVSSGQIILVAEVAGRIGGFLVAQVSSGEAEILNIAVDRTNRRGGMGSALLMAAEAEARAQKAEHMYLEVRESNHAGIAFYTRHGFCQNGKRVGYYRDPPEDAVLMDKKPRARTKIPVVPS
jgi:ribosomal-protein-alanine acetyltransferase